MPPLPSKSKTVLWFLLTAVALPALVFSGESFATGSFYPAVGGAAVGAFALVAFAVSYLMEFPGEDEAKETAQDLSLTDEDIERVALRVGDVVREASSDDESRGE
jgi:hypothetical protein